jgi:hypothetical protein
MDRDDVARLISKYDTMASMTSSTVTIPMTRP